MFAWRDVSRLPSRAQTHPGEVLRLPWAPGAQGTRLRALLNLVIFKELEFGIARVAR